jgi:uncharacterized protein
MVRHPFRTVRPVDRQDTARKGSPGRERTHPDITIQTCWDSDRLDLGRVGVTPHPSRLCSEAAKTHDVLAWADGRACFRAMPSFVKDEWGIDLK